MFYIVPQKPGTPVEEEDELEGVAKRRVHRQKVHKRYVQRHDSEEGMDSENESIGLPHSDESGEEGEHCGCPSHRVGHRHHHIHGHHIHGHHVHGHRELHHGSGGKTYDKSTKIINASSKDKKHLSDSIRVLVVHVKESWVSGQSCEHTQRLIRLIRLSKGLKKMLVIWYFHVPHRAGTIY